MDKKKLTSQAKSRYIKVLYVCCKNALKLTYVHLCSQIFCRGLYPRTPVKRGEGKGREKVGTKGEGRRGMG